MAQAAITAGLLATALPAAAATAACTAIDDDRARLACYDRAAGRGSTSGPRFDATDAAAAISPAARGAAEDAPLGPPPASTERLSLATAWELDADALRGTFNLLPHRLNYLLPARYSLRPNRLPGTPAPGHSVTNPLDIDRGEAKFQLSFKTKVAEHLFGSDGDLWLAYSQQSHWQMYNGSVSSPFRETVHEPEAILTLRTDADVLGWRWRLLNLGFAHQSNGRPLPLSRSWNRLYAQFGLERGDATLLVRPWLRIPERSSSDDNPDIRRYAGSGDVRLAYAREGHLYSALARYSPSGRRGGVQLEWAFPISGALKGYVQATAGYGESLIDYNHAQTTLGAGILLLPWR